MGTVRTCLLLAAAILGPGDRRLLAEEEAAPSLEALFQEPDAEGAWTKLGEIVAKRLTGELPALVQAALATPHPALAWSAGEALAALDARPEGLPPETAALLLAAPPARPEEQRRLIAVLAGWRHAAVDQALARWITTSSALAEEALYAAGSIPVSAPEQFPRCLEAIGSSLRDRRPEVRIAACVAAGRRRAATLVEELVRLVTKDDEEFVGMFAVRALERIAEPVSMERVVRALEAKPKPRVRAACLKGIAALARPVEAERLRPLLAGRAADAQAAAIAAITRWAAPTRYGQAADSGLSQVAEPVREKLVQGLLECARSSGPWSVRVGAARALERVGAGLPAGAIDQLTKWMRGRDEDLTALALIVAAGAKPLGALEAVWTVALGSDLRLHRQLAVRALEAFDPQAAATRLVAALSSERQPLARGRILEALGGVRHESVVRGLVQALAGLAASDTSVPGIEAALERLTGHRFGADARVWETWLAGHPRVLRSHVESARRAETRRTVQQEKRYGLGPQVDQVLERAIDWLARAQRVDGSWRSHEDGWGGSPAHAATYTGLCVRALLGAGYVPGQGRHGEAVWRALEFLAATQAHDGQPAGTLLDRTGPFLGTALVGLGAFMPLTHAWGLTAGYAESRDALHLAAAQRALDFVIAMQNPGSGWGGAPSTNSDTGVTALALYALVDGLSVGLDVPSWTMDAAEEWLRGATSDMDGQVERLSDVAPTFDATIGGWQTLYAFGRGFAMSDSQRREREWTSDFTCTEPAMLARLLLGWPRSHPFIVGAARYVQGTLVDTLEPPRRTSMYVHARLWLATHAMFVMGGEYWSGWTSRLLPLLMRSQQRTPSEVAGSFDSDIRYNDMGRLFATAMVALMLEVPYSHPWPTPR